jgi:predicted AlkP superfamily phosphohydrolase/phosphomutase
VDRTLVVGFDGANLELCERFMGEGRMPVLAGILADGSFGHLRSVFPYNSAVAWASLATGVKPGRHGIFDFVLPRDRSYGSRVATRRDRRVPALWNYASDAGARVGVVNIPITFPAEPVNGVMVSGMDAPRLEVRAVHPPQLMERLAELRPPYRIMSKAYLRAQQRDFEGAERDLIDAVVTRARFVAELASARDLDLLMVNLEATDGSHHFFWEHFDPGHPRHDPALARRFAGTIPRVYETCDRELGRIIQAYAPDTVLVVSDHGGGPSLDWVLYLNDWLEAEGFLTIRRRPGSSLAKRAYGYAMRHLSDPVKQRLRPVAGKAIERAKRLALYGDVDWPSTRAYGTQSAVRLNLRGREPEGTVDRDARTAVLEELAERARARRFADGRPLFTSVSPASDGYAGDGVSAPDLIAEAELGIEVRGRNTSGRPGFLIPHRDLGVYYPSGVHTPVGMVAAAGRGIARGGRVEESDIHQVAASVLAIMGVPIPALDSPPMSFVTKGPTSTGRVPVPTDPAPELLSQDEESEVLERLRGLGYVD